MGKKIIVIGAGIGGIASAALLARRGFEVEVFEKTNSLGGRCDSLVVGGHRFDTGATMFLMPEIFEDFFASLGERVEDHLALSRIDPTCRLEFADGSRLDLSSDLDLMRRQLDGMEPGSFGAYLRHLSFGHEAYGDAIPRFIRRDFDRFSDFATPANLLALLRLKAFRKHYGLVARSFEDQRLRAAFTFQDVYVGMSPFSAPALFSLFPYMEIVNGLWCPAGGMGALSAALVRIARRLGVVFHTESPVKSIEVEERRASAVVFEDGSRRTADIVLADADLPYVYRALLPPDGSASRLRKKHYSCSAITFYLGLKARLDGLATQHSVYFADDYAAGFRALSDPGAMPSQFHFYVNAPTRIDADAAPPGRDTLMVAVPVANADPDREPDYDRLKRGARSYVMERLSRAAGTDVESLVDLEICYTPRTWRDRLNLERGSVFGSLSHDMFQIGWFRPANHHARYRNLYFCGGSTVPGSGVPMVLIGASLVSERIAKEAAS